MNNDILNKVPEKQVTVTALLLKGKYSVNEIIQLTGVQDPRSHIRYIRRTGLTVSDMWVYEKGVRYKKYWIAKVEMKGGSHER